MHGFPFNSTTHPDMPAERKIPLVRREFLLRVLPAAIVLGVTFRFIAMPIRVVGDSMEPTYSHGQLNLCWRLRYRFQPPRPQDIIVIRYAGNRILLLKRVVALAGDTVAFDNGTLVVNGNPRHEPYLRTTSDWQLEPRRVPDGHVYAVGDNRSMPMDDHTFGNVPADWIVGGPLW